MNTATLALRADAKVIGMVSAVHMLSHFYQLVIPPLFLDMRQAFGVGYTELGIALSVFLIVSGVFQTPAGFLVDRLGARRVMLGGLALLAGSTLLIGFAPSMPWLVVAMAIGGLGNSVFHPADLAILNDKVNPQRLGHAFSAHGIGGMIGWALAPVYSIGVSQAYGWRAALIIAGAVGLICLVWIALQGTLGSARGSVARPRGGISIGAQPRAVSVLLSGPLIAVFLFFTLSAIAIVGFQNYAIPVLDRLYQASLILASWTLTAFLAGSAAGFLAGGFLVGMTHRHDLVAGGGTFVSGALLLVMAGAFLPIWALLATATVAGFFLGVSSPSRDTIVRAIVPPAARGKAYGFVYSGQDFGGGVGPTVFGWLMDHDQPATIFVACAASMMLAAFLVGATRTRRAAATS